MLSAFLGLLTFTCLFPSLFFPVAGLITTFYIPPGLPDTFAQPHQCKPNNSTSSGCSLRSAMEACTSYLVDATSLCNIILSPHDRISLDPVLGDIQLVSVSGGLEILGNGATISQMDNSFSNQERFLTLAQLSLNPLTLSISNTSFFGFSSSSGGGVFNFQNLASINLTHNSFWNNSALSGGVLYAEGCTNITISACSFEGNEAEDGGAIQFNSNNHHISIEHSRFHFNHAKGSSISNRNQGGAVYFNLLNSDVKISFCLFDTNEGINGGAVYFHTENQLIVISSCYFKNNHASFGGGVMFYNQNLYVTVKDTVLDSNTALKFYGGGMFTYSSNFDMLLHNLTFTRNVAFYGGGLNADSDNTNLRLISCQFWNNTAHYGAAFTLYSSHQVTLLHDCTFRENKALFEAGAVYIVSINEDIEVYNCEFFSNQAGTNGGALAFVNGNTNITFFRTSFLSNVAGKSGGGIYSALSSINWKAASCIFRDNHAGTYGGALSVANDNQFFTLEDCSLIGNQANIGGAIFFGNSNDYLAIEASNISFNFASEYGGGIVSLGYHFSIHDTIIAGNSALESGGIHVDESVQTIISHISFTNNTAISGRGGGGTILGHGDVLIASSQFSYNTAALGGAVYLASLDVFIYDNTFKFNQVVGDGGSMYCTAIARLVVSSNLFLANAAVTGGGALYLSLVDDFFLNSSTFLENKCTGISARGSAIYLSSSASTIRKNNFSSNSVPEGAGTIFWMHSTMSEPFDLLLNTYHRNYALYGNAVATEGYALLTDETVNLTRYGFPISRFTVALVDYYYQSVKTDSSSTVAFTLPSPSNPSCHNGAAYLTGGIIEDYQSGTAEVAQLDAHCSPGQTIVGLASTVLPEIDRTISVSFEIFFRECVSGEINREGGCQLCPEFYYSFSPTDTECRPCPENAVCSGGNRMRVDKGYWRQCQNCHILEPCRLPDVCLGGETVASQCRIGHTGPLCNICESGYALSAELKCVECSSNLSLITLILGPIFLFLFVLFLIVAYLKRERLLTAITRAANSIQHTIKKYRLDTFQTKVKIFISFTQILTSLPIMFDLDYPPIFERFLHAITFSQLNFLNLFSVGCVWQVDFYESLLMYTIGPVVACLTLCFILHLHMLLALRVNEKMPSYTRQDRNDHMKLVCIFIAFIVFSPTSIHIFQTFVCEEFEDGTVTLVADSSISCSTDMWKYYVTYAAVMCVIYPLGIPCFYMYSLYAYLTDINPSDEAVVVKSELHLLSAEIIQSEKMKYRENVPRIKGLSFLFASYLPKNWYFEIVECFRRLLLTSIPILFLRSKILQIVLVLLISLGFCAVYMELRPFINQSDNLVAIYSQWAISLTVLGSLCLRVDMTDEMNAFGPNAIGIVMTIVNVFVAVLTFVAAIRTESQSEKERKSILEHPDPPPPEKSRMNSTVQNLKFSEVNWQKKKTTNQDSDDDSDNSDDLDEDTRAHPPSTSPTARNPLRSTKTGVLNKGQGSVGVELRSLSQSHEKKSAL